MPNNRSHVNHCSGRASELPTRDPAIPARPIDRVDRVDPAVIHRGHVDNACGRRLWKTRQPRLRRTASPRPLRGLYGFYFRRWWKRLSTGGDNPVDNRVAVDRVAPGARARCSRSRCGMHLVRDPVRPL